ncbi:anticodon-binding domain-containing protein [Spinellus fusiger]|nr:anticodon-binding domain-containing protein [Spinellus fusiger]
MQVTPQRPKPMTRQPMPGSATHPHTPTPTSVPKKQLEELLGYTLFLKTVTNEHVEGSLYTLDRTTNYIALITQGSQQENLSFRILKISSIKDILNVQAPDPQHAWMSSSLRRVHLDALQAKEADALKGHLQQVAKQGVGVTKEAQAIFDALHKTLPCRWSNDTIVVLDEVLIAPPYTIDHCKANSSSAASLARVKKVLEGERRRLAHARKESHSSAA